MSEIMPCQLNPAYGFILALHLIALSELVFAQSNPLVPSNAPTSCLHVFETARSITSDDTLAFGTHYQLRDDSASVPDVVLPFSQRFLEVNPKHSPLKVYEHQIDPFVLVDPRTGLQILGSTDLLASATLTLQKEKFNPQGKPGQGKLQVKGEEALVLPRRNQVAFAANRGTDTFSILIHDLKDHSSRYLGTIEGHWFSAPKMTFEHNRFLIVKEAEGFVLYDLNTNHTLRVRIPDRRVKLHISADGSRLLLEDRETRESRDSNTLVTLHRPWSNSPEPQGTPEELGLAISFTGHVLGWSADFSRLILDRGSRGAASGKGWIPDLVIASLNDHQFSSRSLSGWSRIQNKIQKMAMAGTMIPHLGVSGQMTPDGRYFAAHFRFKTTVESSVGNGLQYVDTVPKDLVGLWNVSSGRSPLIVTSTQMDGDGDSEFRLQDLPLSPQSRIWDRKVAFQLTESGRLIVARANVVDTNEHESKIFIKALQVWPQEGEVMSLSEFQTGIVDLDPHESLGQWTGVLKLLISSAGNHILFEATGVGVRVIPVK